MARGIPYNPNIPVKQQFETWLMRPWRGHITTTNESKWAKMFREDNARLLQHYGKLDATPLTLLEVAVYQRNEAHSPLLHLPTEVRNIIWTYAIGGMTLRPSYSGSNNLLPIGLLLACRQTYTEASTTLFSQNALCLDYDDAQHTRECHLEMLFRNVRLLLFEGRLFNRSFDKRGLKAVERLEVVVQYWSDESMEEKKRRDGEALRRHFGGKKVVFMPRVQGAA